MGATIGPFLAGAIPGYKQVFYMLMASDLCALLVRRFIDITKIVEESPMIIQRIKAQIT